jgi:hypothetical protein
MNRLQLLAVLVIAATNVQSTTAFSKQYHPAPPPLQEILYRRNVFAKDELLIIQADVKQYLGKLRPETMSSVAHGRRGLALPPSAATVDKFAQGSLLRWIHRVTQCSDYQLCTEVPLEIRTYDQKGAGMAWHADDILFTPVPQLEVVWTLENTSDCRTLYRSTATQNVETVETEANSVLLVPAGGPEHCVTSLQRGRRVILKAVYALTDAAYVEEASVAQFGQTKQSRRR